MSEKRLIKRHHLPYFLQVYNPITNRPLGNLVNISAHGMMLVSQTRLLTHAVFRLEIRLPISLLGGKRITFEALSHWSHPDITPESYDTGFSFHNPPERLLALVDALTHYFSFPNEQNTLSAHITWINQQQKLPPPIP